VTAPAEDPRVPADEPRLQPPGPGTEVLFGDEARWIDDADRVDDERARRRGPTLGIVALVLASALFLLSVVGTVLANAALDIETAILIALICGWGTIVSLVLGAIAMVARMGRAFGIVAVVLSVLGNPFVVLGVLALVSGVGP
jgi:hypothetical protein